jgi:polysaccharide pyruvyl transferase WcaK-like protein
VTGLSLERYVDYPVLIVGGYGYRNVGDEAMLAGLLRQLDRSRVTVLSRMPAETAAIHGVRSVSVGRAVNALRGHRTVLIGGGALFGPHMGALGRMLPLYGLFAQSAGRRLLLEGVSLDEPGRATGMATRRLVVAAHHMRVRDRRSVDLLSGWGIDAELGVDLSALLQPSPPRTGMDLLRRAGVPAGRRVVGLALTDVNAEIGARMAHAVVEVMRALPIVEFCFIPMSQHPFVHTHNDLLMGRRLADIEPRLRILEGVQSPADMLAVYGTLSAVVGMRYHSLVFAERCATPLVPVVYAPKCAAWLDERGLTATPPASDAIVAALRDLVPETKVA